MRNIRRNINIRIILVGIIKNRNTVDGSSLISRWVMKEIQNNKNIQPFIIIIKAYNCGWQKIILFLLLLNTRVTPAPPHTIFIIFFVPIISM